MVKKLNDNLSEHVNKMNFLEDEGFDEGSVLEDVNDAWIQESGGEKAFETVEKMEEAWRQYNILAQVLDNLDNRRGILHNL